MKNPHNNTENLSRRIKSIAQNSGFDLVGISQTCLKPQSVDFWKQWIVDGHHGEMIYLKNSVRESITSWWPETKSVLMTGLTYEGPSAPIIPAKAGIQNLDNRLNQNQGKIASYAQYPDYHIEIKKRLSKVLTQIIEIEPKTQGKIFVDTSPILEKSYAQQAGLGWIAKNTMLINKTLGSYFLIGGIALNLELQLDAPDPMSHCGTCTRCIDACPTQCLTPYHLEAQKCISYLTIEKKTMKTDPSLVSKTGHWIFGCDICQQVCPFNKKSDSTHSWNRVFPETINLDEALTWDQPTYKQKIKGTALERTKWPAFQENCQIAARNIQLTVKNNC